jgi:hypothetical protein
MKLKVSSLIYLLAAALLPAFNSCDDGMPKDIEFPDFMSVYLTQASSANLMTVNLMGELDTTLIFPGVRYGGATNPIGVVTANVTYDESLVSAYNETNGTNYVPVPAGVVTVKTPTLTIPDNDFASNRLEVEINDQGLLEESVPYLVPITLASATVLPVKEDSKTFYLALNRTLSRQDLVNDMNEHLKGVWTFDNASDPFKATVGSDLIPYEGGGAISSIDAGGSNLGVMVPWGSYLWMDHNCGANGDGAMTNEYTIMFDTQGQPAGYWGSLYQTDLDNLTDANFWIIGSQLAFFQYASWGDPIGIDFDDRTASGIVPEGKWTRIVITVSLTESNIKTYADGVLIQDITNPGLELDGAYALDPVSVLIAADGWGYDSDINFGELRIWDKPLRAAQIALLSEN